MTTINEQMLLIVKDEIDKLPVSSKCIVTRNYSDGYVDVKFVENDFSLSHIFCIGDYTIGVNGFLTYLNGDFNMPIVITDNSSQNEINTILALGLGLFRIKSDGHLWVELPMGIDNPFSIDNNGHLIVTLPSEASNDYEIVNKHLIYHRGD